MACNGRTSLRQKAKASALITSALTLCGWQLAAQASSRGTLRPLPSAQGDALVQKLRASLPAGAVIETEPSQVFHLAPDGPTVVPVVLQPHGDSSQPAQCGVYLATTYIPLINQKLTYTDMCQSVAGVTAVGNGARPRLLLLFNVNSGHGPDNRLPAVLTWKTSSYQFDEPASTWLAQQPGATSLPAARKLLNEHR